MPVIREQFESGMTYYAYKAQMMRNDARFLVYEKKLSVARADLWAFGKPARPRRVLVRAEAWCADVIAILPIVGRQAQGSCKLDVRVPPRYQSDLFDSDLNEGHFKSIAVVIFLDV